MGSISVSGTGFAALIAALAASLAGAQATPEPAPAGAALDITVTGLRSHDGKLLACLTSNAKAFPGCDKDPKALHVTVPAAGAAHLRFTGVPPGLYAIAIVHDENSNGKLDMALFLPREGVGTSRNPKPRMGPPTFASAAFRVDGADEAMSVEMKYLL